MHFEYNDRVASRCPLTVSTSRAAHQQPYTALRPTDSIIIGSVADNARSCAAAAHQRIRR